MGIPSRRTVRREPVGVVAAITPWNVPTQINLAKVGPALAAGCTVVLKPAPDTPWVACELGRLVAEHTDIPAGRPQRRHPARQRGRRGARHRPARRHGLVHRLDRDRPGDHGRRRADAEEGVPRARRQVRGDRARRRRRRLGRRRDRVRRVHPRRPGLRDHHPAGGAAGAVRRGGPGRRGHDGVDRRQGPDRPRRHLRPGDLAGRSATGSRPTCGSPSEEGGTFATGGHVDRPGRLLGRADGRRRPRQLLAAGAGGDLRAGARRHPARRRRRRGPDRQRLAPTACPGSVDSGSLERAKAVAARIRTGTLAVNGGVWFSPDAPFGGYKQSGIGREMGVAGFEEYLETKTMAEPA